MFKWLFNSSNSTKTTAPTKLKSPGAISNSRHPGPHVCALEWYDNAVVMYLLNHPINASLANSMIYFGMMCGKYEGKIMHNFDGRGSIGFIFDTNEEFFRARLAEPSNYFEFYRIYGKKGD